MVGLFLAGACWVCHLGLPNESQHRKDQLNPFTVETFISAINIVVLFDRSNPQQMVGLFGR
jgi:hypothetical protein